MFTGIIEEVGTVKQITHGQHSEVLNIQARTVLENTKSVTASQVKWHLA